MKNDHSNSSKKKTSPVKSINTDIPVKEEKSVSENSSKHKETTKTL